MFVTTAVLAGLLAVVLVFSGRGKLVRDATIMESMNRVGFPEDRLWLLASAEFAGAVGLVVGLFVWPLGVAAAVGVILYFVGAVASHVRVKDYKGVAPAAVLMLLAVAVLVLRLATR